MCDLFYCLHKDEKGMYAIHVKKFELSGKRSQMLEQLKEQYVEVLEKLVKKYPLQFYQFYDFFCDKIDL